MKDHPILFSGAMVRAILDGKKTQTRRPLRFQPDGRFAFTVYHGLPCPYGAPGDRLWVRETWAHDCPHCSDVRCGNPDHIWYRASEANNVAKSFSGAARWRPSIHMPRWASRLTLEVVSARVERLQLIAGRDVLAEGIDNSKSNPEMGARWENMQRMAFQELWDSINGKRAPWASNPCVWVVEFKKVQP